MHSIEDDLMLRCCLCAISDTATVLVFARLSKLGQDRNTLTVLDYRLWTSQSCYQSLHKKYEISTQLAWNYLLR